MDEEYLKGSVRWAGRTITITLPETGERVGQTQAFRMAVGLLITTWGASLREVLASGTG